MLIPRQAYLGPDGTPRLFRPQLNMERMARSAERVALPVSIPDPLFLHITLTRVWPLLVIQHRCRSYPH
jgi:hypothetical protein